MNTELKALIVAGAFVWGLIIGGGLVYWLKPEEIVQYPTPRNVEFNDRAKELCLSKGKVPVIDGWGKVTNCND